jgi:dTDP-4-dehydrorhamnose reductase
MKILATGMSGLVGQRIKELLPDFEFTLISRQDGKDISKIEDVEPLFADFDGEWVLHMGAKAEVDGCEKDKEMGEDGEAWKVNVVGTENMSTLSKKYNKKLIYISTDFVFDGKKSLEEGYGEEDAPRPINWYGETKYQGEVKVKNSGAESLILRIAYPYGVSSAQKKDFVRIIAERLKNGSPVQGVTDHIMCPTFIDDIAGALKILIEKKILGLYHLVGSEKISPYDAAVLIAQAIGVDSHAIRKTTRNEYFAGKAPRPYNLYLKNDKIKNLGIHMKTLSGGVDSIKENI